MSVFFFKPKREEVAGGWRRPHNEELHNLNALPDIIRVIESRRIGMGRTGSTHRTHKKFLQNFGRKPNGKRPLGRSGRR
jgi:hypothetical protein